jgi:MFS transporter, DHA2 family, multidrug resistance protein
VQRQRRLADPLLDLRLFAERSFSTSLGIMLLAGVVMAGATLLSALYLQIIVGLSPLQAGLWLLPQNVAMVAGVLLAPLLARRFRPAYVVAAGLVVAAAGLLVLTRVGGTNGLDLVVAGLALANGGIALPMALVANLILGSAPPEKAGSAAAMSETGGEFGVALGIATLGSIATAVYRDRLADAIPPDVPAGAARAAHEGIAAAVSVAGRLPAGPAAELLGAAREAFTAGLNAAAGVGAVLFLSLAILAAILLRHVRPYEEGEETDETEMAPVAVETSP